MVTKWKLHFAFQEEQVPVQWDPHPPYQPRVRDLRSQILFMKATLKSDFSELVGCFERPRQDCQVSRVWFLITCWLFLEGLTQVSDGKGAGCSSSGGARPRKYPPASKASHPTLVWFFNTLISFPAWAGQECWKEYVTRLSKLCGFWKGSWVWRRW